MPGLMENIRNKKSLTFLYRAKVREYELNMLLSELAYGKIWSELSQTDRKVLRKLVRIMDETGNSPVKVEHIRKYMNMSSDVFTKYRSRLMDSGIIDGSQYGYLSFRLPRFEKFILTAD